LAWFNVKPLTVKEINQVAAITLRGVSKAYGDNGPVVLRNVDLDIENHEFCVFLGPSGCGKSTITNLLLRFYNTQSGKILIDGHDITEYNV
jgi:multiple sugar transport system ATP-binding protein